MTFKLADQASPSRIAAILYADKSTLSRNLTLMEKAGWLRLSRRGRAVEVVPTEAGQRVFMTSKGGWMRAQARLKQLLKESGGRSTFALSEALAPFPKHLMSNRGNENV